MDRNGANIVLVRFKRNHLFVGIVIENADMHVIRTGDDPILSVDELGSSDRKIGDGEGFDDALPWDKRAAQGCL